MSASRDPVCTQLADVIDSGGRDSRRNHQARRHLRMHGRAAVFHEGRIEYLSQWGMDLIGMTNLQEAKLAREAEICYTTMALVTDYDCWHPEHDAVTVDRGHRAISKRTAKTRKRLIRAAVKRLPVDRTCKCGRALEHAIMTDLKNVPEKTMQKVELLIRKYL